MGIFYYLAMVAGLIIIPSLNFFVWRDMQLHRKIIETGIKGDGRIIECKRIFFTGHLQIFPLYKIVVEFYFLENRFELKPLGIFHSCPARKGELLSIIYSEQYPDNVVIQNADYKKMYINSIIFNLIVYMCLLCFLIYTWIKMQLI